MSETPEDLEFFARLGIDPPSQDRTRAAWLPVRDAERKERIDAFMRRIDMTTHIESKAKPL